MKKAVKHSRRDFLRISGMFGAGLGLLGLSGGFCPPAVFAAPRGSLDTQQQSRLLMGTLVTITAAGAEQGRAEEAFALAFAEMERLIVVFDRHSPSSALSVLNAEGSLSSAPPELSRVLAASARLGAATDYAFNPAITPVVDLFAQSRASGRLPHFDDHELAEALALAGPGEIRFEGRAIRLGRSGMRLTLDGIAKGFIADAASDVLARQGIVNHMVNAGGDIRVMGNAADKRPWKIGIQHPDKAGELLATAPVNAGGIATSGNYEQAYNRSRSSNHLISHLTGKSSEIASVTVKAPSAMQADSLATALALMPPARALAYVEKYTTGSCLIVDRFGRCYVSRSWG